MTRRKRLVVVVLVLQAIVVLVLGLLGLIIGRIIDGQLDVHDIFGKPSQRNR